MIYNLLPMKKAALLVAAFVVLISAQVFSQTVYVTQTGTLYHTSKCPIYAKSFEAVPLWKARDVYRKKPCNKCNPPTKDVKVGPKKKKTTTAKPKPKPKPAVPAKK